MLTFIVKGLLRDRSRSIFPLIVIVIGVMITVFFVAFINGFLGGMIKQNANLSTGHVKVMTRSYIEAISQKPFDLSMLDISDDIQRWENKYPKIEWVPRITFAAKLDVPDSDGLTVLQGNISGMAVDLLSNDAEIKRLRLKEALRVGSLPHRRGQILVSEILYNKMHLNLGQRVTLISSTVFGAMTLQDFEICGAVSFGVQALDRGAVVADISDVRYMLDLENGASEILGYFTDADYDDKRAKRLAEDFNRSYSDSADEFSPQMLSLSQQNDLDDMLSMFSAVISVMLIVFILLMSIILWNSGLLNSIRRYGEFGLRLAMGELKKHLYLWLVLEAAIIGLVGSVIGTILGLLISLYTQSHGLDMSSYTKQTAMFYNNVLYAQITPMCYYIGLVPGMLAVVGGAMLAGIGIFSRKTSQLFKELET